MTGNRKDYSLDSKPIGSGGQAEVFRALWKSKNIYIAFKKTKTRGMREDARFRREIELMTKLRHENIMPIWDYDLDFRWYVMPLARGSLKTLRDAFSERELVEAVLEAARGLAFAHSQGPCHRDVTPNNMMLVGNTWVVSDFGVARRAPGETTEKRTGSKDLLGTDGFRSPESWDDQHDVDSRSDIYSLGRVIGWAIMGSWPAPNIPMLPEGKWRYLVKKATDKDPNSRYQTVEELIEAATEVLSSESSETDWDVGEAIKKLKSGEDKQYVGFLERLNEERLESVASIYFDEIPTAIDWNKLDSLVRTNDDLLLKTAEILHRVINDEDIGRRSFDSYNRPLGWLRNIAQLAVEHRKWGLAEDISDLFFELAPRMCRFGERHDTRRWLNSLRGIGASTIARSLSRHIEAIDWYTEENWTPSHSIANDLRRVLFPKS